MLGTVALHPDREMLTSPTRDVKRKRTSLSRHQSCVLPAVPVLCPCVGQLCGPGSSQSTAVCVVIVP